MLDLGCGTGQLAYPFAEVAGAVIGMDPSVDMLARAAADTDVPVLETLLGKESLGDRERDSDVDARHAMVARATPRRCARPGSPTSRRSGSTTWRSTRPTP
ncbi:class I SAM-dependent methyltransferase [Amycolatopsis xylanica]|uniref:class I SAM-dependent methyltransferase n=1 Tax=Amycolatopsis xylanica TaxID=589385 RepID=UPI001FDF0C5C|nr:class I SAM-dependent methyltransferase [Amycolatopsis xylanica]